MVVRTKPTTGLIEAEVIALYNIHRKRYFGMGQGRCYDIWKEDLGLLYHNGLTKQMHIFGTTKGIIEGYAIATQRVWICADNWSKLLEFAVDSVSSSDNRSLLLNMVREIAIQNPNNPTFYLAEINFERKDILNLFHQAGFQVISNMGLLEALISRFMHKPKIRIHETSTDRILERPTQLTSAYASQWLTNYIGIR